MHTEQREMYASLHINVCGVHICNNCLWTIILIAYFICRKTIILYYELL